MERVTRRQQAPLPVRKNIVNVILRVGGSQNYSRIVFGLVLRARHQQQQVMSNSASSNAHAPANAPTNITGWGILASREDNDSAASVGLAVAVLEEDVVALDVETGVGFGGENARM